MAIGIIRNLGGSSSGFIPFEKDFSYVGDIQQCAIPSTGVYKLEVWGGQGGYSQNSTHPGGKGGYSVGYALLNKNEMLYICCGGKGTDATSTRSRWSGGYNGGGDGRDTGYDVYPAGGGGATHIAKVDGTLYSIGYDSFVTLANGLIVAGGGGGGYYGNKANPGAGGGMSGGNGANYDGNYSFATGGTQTSGYEFGKGGSAADAGYCACAGSGGGFYGGNVYNAYCAGSGGSGWIGGVPSIAYKGQSYSSESTSGVNTGNGKAKITRMA